MRISSKIIISSLILAVIGLIIGYLGYYSTELIINIFHEVIEEEAAEIMTLGKIAFLSQQYYTYLIALDPTNSELSKEIEIEKWIIVSDNLDKEIRNYEGLEINEPEEAHVSVKLKDLKAELDDAAENLIKAKMEVVDEQEIFKKKQNLDKGLEGFQSYVDMHMGEEQEELEENIEFAEESFDNTLSVIVLVTTSLFIIALGSGFIISGRISYPLRRLEVCASQVAKGNFEVEFDQKSNDEIGRFAKTFNSMIVNLKKIMLLERELGIKEQQLKNEKFTTIGELGARLAHDLRNPLSLIKNNVELLRRTSSDEQFKKKSEFERIDAAINRISHQVENVLDFVRDRKLSLKETNLSKILKSLVEDHENKQTKIELPQQDIMIKCDSYLLDIAFINLLTNAKQAIDKSGEVIIRAKENAKDVVIEFQDSGPGIRVENLSTIFEPLFTTREEGTGLGLASCKNIIEKHGGQLTVSNYPTVFRVTLPKSEGELS